MTNHNHDFVFVDKLPYRDEARNRYTKAFYKCECGAGRIITEPVEATTKATLKGFGSPLDGVEVDITYAD